MKEERSKASIYKECNRILSVGYCNLQYLLNTTEPFAYSTREEGWACDYYLIPRGICISTGYDPIGKHVGYDFCHKYDEVARIICNETWDYETRKKRLNNLLADFAGDIEREVFNDGKETV